MPGITLDAGGGHRLPAGQAAEKTPPDEVALRRRIVPLPTDNCVDTSVPVVHHHHSYGTQPHRRHVAPGPSPVGLRRVCLPARHGPRSRGEAGTSGVCQYRQPRRSPVRRSTRAESGLHLPTRCGVMRFLLWARASGGVAVSKTDDRGFDTFRACSAPGNQSGHQHLDNRTGIVVGASATGPASGSVAPWGAAGGRPAVFRHRGFDSLPAHDARHA